MYCIYNTWYFITANNVTNILRFSNVTNSTIADLKYQSSTYQVIIGLKLYVSF